MALSNYAMNTELNWLRTSLFDIHLESLLALLSLSIVTHPSWLSLSLSYTMTDGQSASLSWYQTPIWGLMIRFLLLSNHCGFFVWGALSDERTGLSFTMYNVRYTIYFTVSDLRFSQPGESGPCIYIPQEQGGPVIPPGTRLSLLTPDSWFLSKLLSDRRESTSLQGSLHISPIPAYRLPAKLFGLPREQSISLPVTAETPTKVVFGRNAFSEAVA
jgi:hypothetical protein